MCANRSAGITRSIINTWKDLLKRKEARPGQAAAEPLLRECLALREKIQPNSRNAFSAQSMLGKALLGQKRYADAEPLLLAGYQGRKRLEAKIPLRENPNLAKALEYLIQLYEATDKPEEAARWQKELEASKGAEKPPEQGP